MQSAAQSSSTYHRKLFLFNSGGGLLIGGAFPFVATLSLGQTALTPAFFFTCLLVGLCLGTTAFWVARLTLKKHLTQQLQVLNELLG